VKVNTQNEIIFNRVFSYHHFTPLQNYFHFVLYKCKGFGVMSISAWQENPIGQFQVGFVAVARHKKKSIGA